jgi:hypothetical protein
MNSLRPLILIMPRLLWTCLRISYPRSYHSIIPSKVKNKNGFLTLSEFENFLLCEQILINVTSCQNETSS